MISVNALFLVAEELIGLPLIPMTLLSSIGRSRDGTWALLQSKTSRHIERLFKTFL